MSGLLLGIVLSVIIIIIIIIIIISVNYLFKNVVSILDFAVLNNKKVIINAVEIILNVLWDNWTSLNHFD